MTTRNDLLLLKTLNGIKSEQTPIWIMRQAGRYLPEYREVRKKYGFLEMVKTPEVAAEITLQPIRRFSPDGAIIFADILTPLTSFGLDLSFHEGEGPRLSPTITTLADIKKLTLSDPRETVAYTLDALKIVRRELEGKPVALLGFAGAPFTLSSYMIEGGSPGDLHKTKCLMFSDPKSWNALQEKLVTLTVDYLVAQTEAGAEALQLFDSWLGYLGPNDFDQYVAPHLESLVSQLRARTKVPLIWFSTGTAGLYSRFARFDFNCVGVDWRVTLKEANALLSNRFPLQGNLDPLLLLGPWEKIQESAANILNDAKALRAHVFNLGHGILPPTPIENVERLIHFVREA